MSARRHQQARAESEQFHADIQRVEGIGDVGTGSHRVVLGLCLLLLRLILLDGLRRACVAKNLLNIL